MIIAKTNYAHLILKNQFKEKKVIKKYYAMVHGTPKNELFEVNRPIYRHTKNRYKMSVSNDDLKGKEALTKFRLIKSFNTKSLLECNIETGRTHQIRVHLQSVQLPIIGDPIYTNKKEKI